MEGRNLQDHPGVKLLTLVCDFMIVNLLWLICCLPVVTAGAATKAMYGIMLKLARKEPVSTFREFFQEFREGFVPSLILWCVTAAALVIFAGDLWFASMQAGSMRLLFLLASAVAGVVSLSFATWCFSLAASFENTVVGHLKNALAMTFVAPAKTVGMWLIYACPVLLFVLVPETMQTILFPLYLLMGVAMPCFFVAKLQQTVYRRIHDRQSDKSAEE